MRILYITANLPYGSDEAFLLSEIEELQRAGHQVLIVPRSPQGPVIHGAHLIRQSKATGLWSRAVFSEAFRVLPQLIRALPLVLCSRSFSVAAKNFAVLPKAAWLARVARRWKADHIHCHWAGTTATMAMFASQWSGVPWSFTAHRWDIVENNLLALKSSSAQLARFISEDGRNMARALGVTDSDRVRVIHMGVRLQHPESAAANGDIVLCPARLVEVKGHKHLLEAWRVLRSHGIGGQLWIAGDGPLRRTLEAQAASLGIGDSVKFLGTVPHETLLQMYQTVGIAAVVLPSLELGNGCHEGIPVALIEAMSFGIPVIGTEAGGTTELLRDRAGLLVKPGSAADLSAALETILSDSPERMRLAAHGEQRVQEEFDVVHTVRELVTALADGLPHHRDGARVLSAVR